MAYIIFLQPAILSGQLSGEATGMDFDAVTVATCLSAALATAIMGLYARYPIAQAPGMGENFFFLAVLPVAAAMIKEQVAAGTLSPGETAAWQVALGVVFVSGVLFLCSRSWACGKSCSDTTSPSMRHAMAGGIGLFIAFIGLKNVGLILPDPGNLVRLMLQPGVARSRRLFLRAALDRGALRTAGARGHLLGNRRHGDSLGRP